MERKVLSAEESFYEFPDGILEINKKSNLVYINMQGIVYVAKEVIKSVEHNLDNVNYIINYYDIKNNEKLLKLNIEKSLDSGKIDYISNNKDLEIIPLINILNIKENNVVYFSAKDVDTLIKYKLEEKSFKRKTYF